jgi:hypothetical protein
VATQLKYHVERGLLLKEDYYQTTSVMNSVMKEIGVIKFSSGQAKVALGVTNS